MKIRIVILLALCIILSFRNETEYAFMIPEGWPAVSYDMQRNPLSENTVKLGKALFYDPLLSADNSISCASCHSQYTAFAHVDHALSHGIHDSIGKRNAPALMNLVWQNIYMWDGAVNHLDVQALAPISNPAEMGENLNHVTEKLRRSTYYRKKFYAAFHDSTITGEHTLKAISQFLLTLVSCNSKYDSVMNQQAVFTAQEENGYRIFQQHCNSCHKEPLFTNHHFENNGLPADTLLNDKGRMVITGNADDQYKFKVPTLRNIEFSSPYMHDGRYKKLSQVIHHYTNGVVHYSNLSAELKSPPVLSSNAKTDLIAFLLTLSDKKFLFNPEYSFPTELKSEIQNRTLITSSYKSP